ncbi:MULTISPECIES: toxin-antitoxin system YwqK family antitoxin [Aquimarina]|uniref:Nicotinic acid mononucleotide adenyltransferase n=1 Tax=Aquimarina algiphila TaxID=2047982 RepID=A0A554VGQ8_9FLAO|nr:MULTISPECIES: nicotinic acid mononucleotide adenyltransferase [Aquimarina]TSE06585.1 nicotinic acid mononucleotide adenyltransferase [Aquimarina algiphila]
MRNLVIAIALMFSATIFAQEVKPTFEKQGDLIKGTFFYQDGSVRQQGFYNKEGKLHGEWKSYDATGKKIAMGQYSQGVKTGKWFFWSADKLSEVNYSDNQIADVTTWSNKDNVVVNYNN